METKELSTEVKSYSLDLTSAEVLKTLRETVAKGATDAEFVVFVEMVRTTGLNPFKKEVWFIKVPRKQGGQVVKDRNGNVVYDIQMMTGINGFYTIANRHPQYDGIEVDVICQGERIIKAIAKVHRKDRKFPSVAEAFWCEYSKPFGNWKIMPRVMISKCAESMALRKAFPQELNGLYSEEEMPREFGKPSVFVADRPAAPIAVADSIETDDLPESWTSKPDSEGGEAALSSHSAQIISLDFPALAHAGKSRRSSQVDSIPSDSTDHCYKIDFNQKSAFKAAAKEIGAACNWSPEQKLWITDREIPGFEAYRVGG